MNLQDCEVEIARLKIERDMAVAIVGELAALIPLNETIAATKTGRDMVQWFKSKLVYCDLSRLRSI